jgi:hypothetical protein
VRARDLADDMLTVWFDSAHGQVSHGNSSWPSSATNNRLRSVLDERHAQFGGVYVGKNSLPAIRQEVESADWVLMCGKLESDFKCVLPLSLSPLLTPLQLGKLYV